MTVQGDGKTGFQKCEPVFLHFVVVRNMLSVDAFALLQISPDMVWYWRIESALRVDQFKRLPELARMDRAALSGLAGG